MIASAGISITGTDNWCVNATDNVIETASTRNTIAGGGSATGPNKIGSPTKPAGGGATFPVGHNVDDSGYVAESVYVATIGGGYDHINNQLAGTICGGGHNFIKYNAGGHSTIVGGSYHLCVGSYGFIGGGTGNAVAAASGSCSVVGGSLNVAGGNYSVVVGGLSSVTSADYAMAFGRRAQAIYNGTVVLSDDTDADFASTASKQFAARFTNGYYLSGGALTVKRNDTTAGSTTAKIDNSGTAGNEVGLDLHTSPAATTGSVRVGRITGKMDGAGYSDTRIVIQNLASGNATIDTLTLKDSNVGINQATWGTNAQKVLAIGTGTIPASSPADACQLYSADQAAGNACLHTRTEGGAVIKLYQGAAVANPGAGEAEAKLIELLTILRAQGLIAT
jgi:hypothetical protein